MNEIEQYVYLHPDSMATSAAEHRAPDPYDKHLSVKKGKFKNIWESLMTATVNKDRIWNTISFDRATPAPLAETRNVENTNEYMPNEPFDDSNVKACMR